MQGGMQAGLESTPSAVCATVGVVVMVMVVMVMVVVVVMG